MPSPSKEKDLMGLFFNFPAKHWRFRELREKAGLSDAKLAKWLNKFVKEELIKRIKPRNRMPYYISNQESSNYRNTKKVFALEELHKSGLLNHLSSLKAEAVIIFGSFTRWDWYKKSDIDLFILGDAERFRPVRYEAKLHREIQVFHAANKKDLNRYGDELMKNIIMGDIIKGNLRFLEVKVNA